MAPSIGVNLRVTGHCDQGDRKYMEDVFSVAYQHTREGQDLEYAYFGIFDGHGGKHAAIFAKEHLMDNIVCNPYFWSENDEDVLKAIKEGFIVTHMAMYKVLDTWPKTMSGLPSTSGSTASIAFIRRGKLFTGHVGDSGIVLGYQDPDSGIWYARPLTQDHKPESAMEISRIQEAGGKVVWKAGVPRVVWNRPKIGHQGPVLRSTHIDEIPFLAVARSLGDLWSYNSSSNQFVVSPEPDVSSMTIDVTRHRCLILGTDGLWNMIPPQRAVEIVQHIDRQNKSTVAAAACGGSPSSVEKIPATPWSNPSKRLVNTSLDYWRMNKLRADNCTAVTALLDPPGPPLSGLLRIPEDSGGGAQEVPAAVAPPVATTKVIEQVVVEASAPELAALLSSPAMACAECPAVAAADVIPEEEDPTFRVLRNRTLSLSSLDNAKKATAMTGLRKKVVTIESGALNPMMRKRPVTRRSQHEGAAAALLADERNASDTENQVKKLRKSAAGLIPVAAAAAAVTTTNSGASQRILRSSGGAAGTGRTPATASQFHRRKRSRTSFSPVKRRK